MMSIRYTVHRGDLILSVSDGGLAFARENGASDLTRDSVLRSSLWDPTSGEEAIEHLDHFGGAPLPRITHGVCPYCEASL